ncbi:winged helix-turn-helix transcriptional regulator [Paenibacillus sacheonensis]|uniref:Transcriptional regulator n=1 Tax=Paenibacillus sacheonensis TaxID=742054 RepID=A0A7X5BZU4_9BACL|nr:helix-turn-helix domain-containing protein [Paenibacillus sacheonensis]NBC67744.1 transcriptional regulator [Paenibacillus sacheonensis]
MNEQQNEQHNGQKIEQQLEQQKDQQPSRFTNICSVLEILGAKWAFLVIAELSAGPKRFNQLNRDMKVVKTQSLTDVLRHLERSGIVRREVFPTVPVTVEYALTEKGHGFQSALKEMEKWAVKWGDGTNNDPREKIG